MRTAVVSGFLVGFCSFMMFFVCFWSVSSFKPSVLNTAGWDKGSWQLENHLLSASLFFHQTICAQQSSAFQGTGTCRGSSSFVKDGKAFKVQTTRKCEAFKRGSAWNRISGFT